MIEKCLEGTGSRGDPPRTSPFMPAGSLRANAGCEELANATTPVAVPKDFTTKLRRHTANAEAPDSVKTARA
jgi:hypothetical protein